MVEKVIEGILDLPLTEQCQNALMKMTYCSQCAGYDSVELLPCQGLCLNSLRGCLVDFADLEGPIREFTDALTNLNSHLTEPYSPWVQITQLDPYFFGIVTATQTDYATINENVCCVCVCVCVCAYEIDLTLRGWAKAEAVSKTDQFE